MVFYPPSPRFISEEAAADLTAALALAASDRRPALAGLFVNVPLAEMSRKAEKYGLDYLQLSGDETPAQVAEVAQVRPVIRAVRLPAQVSPAQALELAAPYGELANVTLLLDTHKAGLYGGTGETGDWRAAREIAARFPVLLAGGLTPANVGQAVLAVRPWGVDVSSGVEQSGSPGMKDPLKIEQFCQAARLPR
jgi:phosphoribosylanthranilate isomerase